MTSAGVARGHAHAMRRRRSGNLATAALIALFACGCGDDPPAVCDSLDAVRASVDDLRHANISENGLSQVRSDLQRLKQDIDGLTDAGRAQFEPQISAVRAAAEQLSTSVTAASAEPTAVTLAAVGGGVTGLADAVRGLTAAMSETC
jgi:hypothetical protein